MVTEFADGHGEVAAGAFDSWQDLRDTLVSLCWFEELGHKECGGLRSGRGWTGSARAGGEGPGEDTERPARGKIECREKERRKD